VSSEKVQPSVLMVESFAAMCKSVHPNALRTRVAVPGDTSLAKPSAARCWREIMTTSPQPSLHRLCVRLYSTSITPTVEALRIQRARASSSSQCRGRVDSCQHASGARDDDSVVCVVLYCLYCFVHLHTALPWAFATAAAAAAAEWLQNSVLKRTLPHLLPCRQQIRSGGT